MGLGGHVTQFWTRRHEEDTCWLFLENICVLGDKYPSGDSSPSPVFFLVFLSHTYLAVRDPVV